MEIESLEVYSEQSNKAIVRMNNRNYPGLVIQGDSLSILFCEIQELSLRLCEIKIKDEELLYLAQGLQEKLLDSLLHYQQILQKHNIELPFSKVFSAADLINLVQE